MSASLFREGDVVIGRFACGVRRATVAFADRHSDALVFVDAHGRDLGPLVGGFVVVDEDGHDAPDA